MKDYMPEARVLAAHILTDYSLTEAERESEIEHLARALQRTVTQTLEILAHRRVA